MMDSWLCLYGGVETSSQRATNEAHPRHPAILAAEPGIQWDVLQNNQV